MSDHLLIIFFLIIAASIIWAWYLFLINFDLDCKHMVKPKEWMSHYFD